MTFLAQVKVNARKNKQDQIVNDDVIRVSPRSIYVTHYALADIRVVIDLLIKEVITDLIVIFLVLLVLL